MSRALRVWLLVGAVGLFLGIRGGGLQAQERVTKQFQLKDFSSVELRINAQVSITQGESFWVKADARGKGFLDGLEVEVKGSRLVIGGNRELKRLLDADRRFPAVRVQVTLPQVEGLYLQGSGEMLLTSGITGAGDFTVNISGSGDVDLRNVSVGGKVTLSLSGSGDIKAVKLRGSAVTVALEGSGDIVVEETVESVEAIDCTLSGSGDLRLPDLAGASLRAGLSGSGDVSYRIAKIAGDVELALNGSGEIQGNQLLSGGNVVIDLSGSGNVSHSVLEGKRGNFKLSSSGEISVRDRGTMDGYTVLVTGSGDVVLGRLSGGVVEVRGSGSGDVSVFAREQLVLDGLRGSMGLSYRGDACVKIVNSRGVSINRID